MTRNEFIAFVKDVHEHPEHLADYRKKYKNVYPFSDGIFKMLMANEAKPKRTVKFLNAMLGLSGDKAIVTFTLGVPENPGVLNDKTAIFDIYGTTQAGEPILIEIQQNFNTLFIDRLIYYTARVVSRTVKKAQDYKLPHIYVLSILTENQFPRERNTYLHHAQLVRNHHLFYEKLDIFLIELDKFFAKDVSLKGYTDETLLNEVDGMTDMLYEKQGAYLQAKIDDAQAMLAEGLSVEMISRITKLSEREVLKLKKELEKTTAPV